MPGVGAHFLDGEVLESGNHPEYLGILSQPEIPMYHVFEARIFR